MFTDDETTYSSDAGHIVEIKLNDLLSLLINNRLTYKIKGVINYHRGSNKLRISVRHYNTYYKRGDRCVGN